MYKIFLDQNFFFVVFCIVVCALVFLIVERIPWYGVLLIVGLCGVQLYYYFRHVQRIKCIAQCLLQGIRKKETVHVRNLPALSTKYSATLKREFVSGPVVLKGKVTGIVYFELLNAPRAGREYLVQFSDLFRSCRRQKQMMENKIDEEFEVQ